jgi:hypothetical protein
MTRAPLSLAIAALSCTVHATASSSTNPPAATTEPSAPTTTTTPTTKPAAEATPTTEVDRFTLPPRPEWTDRYAASNTGDVRFFEISALMRAHGLTRDRAVEVQNHYRDLARTAKALDPSAHFAEALARAKAGTFEDRRESQRLAAAPFIVVFDLDETLYDQHIDPAVASKCRDFEIDDGKKTRAVKLAPGANTALDRVAALGGAVVIFTAAPDDSSYANLRAWQFGGKPLPEHPAIAGVLTNSHLVLQHKREGTDDPAKGHPVIEPAKDLRIVDETLTRAILVDDNPLRTFQPRNLRVVKKLDAAAYCTTTDAKLKKAFEQTLPTVVREIEDSLGYAEQHGVPFATAYLPFTQIGRVAVDFLRGAGMSERAAIAHVRTHPEVVDDGF